MIKRIVKMSFHPESVDEFIEIFRENWTRIQGFDGCRHVELLRDSFTTNIFFTYSVWESNEHLDAYRRSELFEKVWSETKKLFNDKPQAWSVVLMEF